MINLMINLIAGTKRKHKDCESSSESSSESDSEDEGSYSDDSTTYHHLKKGFKLYLKGLSKKKQ